MRFLIVDCETTGLEEDDEPISIGAILCEYTELRTGEILQTYYSEQQPSRDISCEAHAIHGISEQQLRGELFNLELLSGLIDSAEIVLAHNARFDARMLCKKLPHILRKSWRCTFNQLTYPNEVHRESLDLLCRLNGVERLSPHNALRDCQSLLGVLNKRLGKTTRSNTHLGRVVTEPAWPVFSKRHPMIRLESTNDILFSQVNEPRLLECVASSPIRLWTKDHLDFVVGYFRYGKHHGRQSELFRFLKADNPHVSHSMDEGDDYLVQSFNDNEIVIGPSPQIPPTSEPLPDHDSTEPMVIIHSFDKGEIRKLSTGTKILLEGDLFSDRLVAYRKKRFSANTPILSILKSENTCIAEKVNAGNSIYLFITGNDGVSMKLSFQAEEPMG